MRRVFQSLLNVKPGEGSIVAILLVFIFFIQSVLSTGRTLQISVFMDSYGREALALAFLVSALILAAVASAYSALTRLVRLGVLVPATLVVLAAGFVGWRLAFGGEAPTFPWFGTYRGEAIHDPYGPFVLYAWVEIAASITLVQAWAFVSDVFDPRQAKRLIPLVGLGASLSFALSGFVIHPLVKYAIDAEELAWIVAGSLLLSILFFELARAITARKATKAPKPTGARRARPAAEPGFLAAFGAGFRQIAATPLLRLFAIITVTTIITQGLLDYVFYNELRAQYAKNELASFIAIFFGVLGVTQVLLQMFVSGRMLTLLGSTICLMIMPVVVGAGSLLYVLIPTFWLFVGVRFADRVLKQAFYSPSVQALYTPIPKVAKRQAMTLIKGVVSPLAFALMSAVLLLVSGNAPLRYIALGILAMTAGSAVYLWFRARGAYVEALAKALERRRIDPDDLVEDFSVAIDGEMIRLIERTVFEGEDEGKAQFALGLLHGGRTPRVRELLFRACRHPSPRVRATAADLMASSGLPEDGAELVALMREEGEPTVIAEYLETLARLGTEGESGAVLELLGHDNATVAAAATLCALRLGLDPAAAEARFEALVHAEEQAPRVALASELQHFAHDSLTDRCRIMLDDPSERVRGEALRAAAMIRADDLLGDIMRCFVDTGPHDEAAAALAALGDTAVPPLRAIAEDSEAPHALRRRVPRILASVDTDAAGAVLEALLSDRNDEIRMSAIRSLTRITKNPGGYDRPPRQLVLERLRDEVAAGHVLHLMQLSLIKRQDAPERPQSAVLLAAGHPEEAKVAQKSELLAQELGFRFAQSLERIFALAALIEDAKLAATILWNLKSDDTRQNANAIELVDTAFERDVAILVVPLVERSQALSDVARLLPKAATVFERASEDPIAAVVEGHDEWLRLCAAVGWPDRVAKLDPDLYRRVTEMLPVIEQILFLQSVPIFSELSGEELHFIAGITEEVSLGKDTTIFKEGDPGDAMYLILHGSVSIIAKGTEVARFGTRDCFGEMAVLDNLPRSADAITAEDTDLLRIEAQSFDELLQEKYQIVKGIFKVLSARLRRSTKQQATARSLKAAGGA